MFYRGKLEFSLLQLVAPKVNIKSVKSQSRSQYKADLDGIINMINPGDSQMATVRVIKTDIDACLD
jgi:hypothetical protein